jgi:hypothetical protein
VLGICGFDLKRTLEMDPEFLNTDGEHEHDASVTSLSIIQDGEVDLGAMQEWVGKVLRENGADIYRMKGVIAVALAEEKYVYQAVHMIFQGNFDYEEKWAPDEKRVSKLVFIGKDLDKEGLKKGFASCVLTPEMAEAKRAKLRFKIGDKVECNTGPSGWLKGKIVDLMYRDEYMKPGMVAPYQVELNDGRFIYAPHDVEQLIRAQK